MMAGRCLPCRNLSLESIARPTAMNRGKGWTLASRSSPAFAVSQLDSRYKTETYESFRHPKAAARTSSAGPTRTKQANRRASKSTGRAAKRAGKRPTSPHGWNLDGLRHLEAAGIIDSKFGTVTLLHPVGFGCPRACLDSSSGSTSPNFRISGWSCEGQHLARPARRHRVPLKPTDPAYGRQRPETRRLICPCRTQARRLHEPAHARFVGRFG